MRRPVHLRRQRQLRRGLGQVHLGRRAEHRARAAGGEPEGQVHLPPQRHSGDRLSRRALRAGRLRHALGRDGERQHPVSRGLQHRVGGRAALGDARGSRACAEDARAREHGPLVRRPRLRVPPSAAARDELEDRPGAAPRQWKRRARLRGHPSLQRRLERRARDGAAAGLPGGRLLRRRQARRRDAQGHRRERVHLLPGLRGREHAEQLLQQAEGRLPLGEELQQIRHHVERLTRPHRELLQRPSRGAHAVRVCAGTPCGGRRRGSQSRRQAPRRWRHRRRLAERRAGQRGAG